MGKNLIKHIKKKAFTLIEMLAVVSLIAILFIIFIPRIDFATDKVKEAGLLVDFHSYQIAFKSAHIQKPDLLNSIGNDLVLGINSYLDKELHIDYSEETGYSIPNALDPWGQNYRFIVSNNKCYVISSGPDKEFSGNDEQIASDADSRLSINTINSYIAYASSNTYNLDNYALIISLGSDGNLDIQTPGLNEGISVGSSNEDDTNNSGGEQNKLTITYKSSGNGTVNSSSMQFDMGSTIEFPSVTPDKWYTFSRWVDAKTNEEISEGTIVTSDMELIAEFIKDEVDLTTYYTFTDDTANTGGWKVGLKPMFMNVVFELDESKTSYGDWSLGDSFPPLPATYDGKPVTSYKEMFVALTPTQYSPTSLDLSTFDTSNVVDMSEMFSNCHKLEYINLSSFDTSKVKYMNGMFWKCNKLSNLDVSMFDTSKVIDMNWMFYSCTNLTDINVSNFNTSKVTNMAGMFENCNKLESIDVSSFDTYNVTDMSKMFYNCMSLTELDLSNFRVNNVTTFSGMIQVCSSLEVLDLSGFDLSSKNYYQLDDIVRASTNIKTAYGRTQSDCDKLNNSYYTGKQGDYEFVVKK